MGVIADLFVKLSLNKKGFDQGLDDTKKKTSALGQGFSKIGGMIASVFAVGAITGFISGIIKTRSEFEKYEAVLTNTLGSNKKAREEMRMLQEVAAKTPFSLSELTGAYVKLVNYGLKPTKEEIVKLGDLASSTGKGFDQLTEAVADAVTGQFERLKEFGIKASKEGDKVTFSFKEQKTAVDNNAASIKQYLIGLGNLQGVSGSMAAVSETLGGKISNLGDTWDKLLNTLGGASSGVFTTVIGWLSSMVETLTWAAMSIADIKSMVLDKTTSSAMEGALKEIETMQNSLQNNGMSEPDANKRAIELYYKSIEDRIAELNKSRKEGTAVLKQALIDERNAVKNHLTQLELDRKKVKDKGSESKLNKEIGEKEVELSKLPKNTVAYYEAEIALLEAKHKLITDPQLLAQSQKEIDLKKDMLGQLTSEIKLLERKGTLEDAKKTIKSFLPEVKDPDTSKLDMSQGMKADVYNSEATTEAYNNEIEKAKQFTEDLNSVLKEGIGNAIVSFSEGIGELFAGDLTGKEFGSQLLDVVGKFMQTLGGLFITMGIGMMKFNAGLTTMNPWVMIGAGAVLVATGAAISSLSSKGMKETSTASSPASGYSSSKSSSRGMKVDVGGEFILRGDRLIAVVNNTNRKNSLMK